MLILGGASFHGDAFQSSLESFPVHPAVVVETGEEAIARAAEQGVDIVLIDMDHTGGENGFETALEIVSRFALPVIVACENGSGGTIPPELRAVSMGVLEKPFNGKELKISVETALHVAEAKRQLRQAETARRETEEKYRLLLENSRDVISILDRQLLYSYVSPSVKHSRGFDPEELIGRPLHQAITPGSYEKAKRLFSKDVLAPKGTVAQEDRPQVVELEMYRKDGSTVWSESRVALLRDETGQFTGYINVSTDIDETKKINEQLRESEEKYRTIIENIEDGYYEVDTLGNFTFFNENICTIAGRPSHEIWGVNYRDYTGTKDAKRLFRAFSRIFRTGKPVKAFDLQVYRADGENRYVEISASLIRDPSGTPAGFRGIMRDITDRKRVEEEKAKLEVQLMHANKMEAVGTLAGGVAHDFNNILQAINGYTQLLLINKSPDDRDYDKLVQLEKAGERASGLVQQLLTFSRKAGGERRPLSLNQEIVSVQKLLDQTIPKMIETRLNMADDLWRINADPLQMEQILLNLASNAADAMPGGGYLTIETKNIVLNETYCTEYVESVPGNYVLLTVSDTGSGMDPETRRYIFDPFYTTKPVGKGTGLGLASVYGIVKEHGGLINCYSEIGQGTIFKIYFPAVLTADDSPGKKDDPSTVFQGEGEGILVIDDEETVREMAKEMLEYYGYKVFCAENGECALNMYQDNLSEIDLVILDLNMPGMGGYKCMQALLEIDPEAKVLIASGYSTDYHAKQALSSGAVSFIGKPYHLQEMARKVRAAIDDDRY